MSGYGKSFKQAAINTTVSMCKTEKLHHVTQSGQPLLVKGGQIVGYHKTYCAGGISAKELAIFDPTFLVKDGKVPPNVRALGVILIDGTITTSQGKSSGVGIQKTGATVVSTPSAVNALDLLRGVVVQVPTPHNQNRWVWDLQKIKFPTAAPVELTAFAGQIIDEYVAGGGDKQAVLDSLPNPSDALKGTAEIFSNNVLANWNMDVFAVAMTDGAANGPKHIIIL